MKLGQLFAAASLLALAAPAEATISTYSTQSSFSSAAGSVTTENFESCPHATTSFSGSVSSSSGPCSAITPGVTFSPQQGSLYIAGPGQSTNPTTALGMDLYASDPISITFGSGITAFGANLFQNFVGGTQSSTDVAYNILVYGAGNTLLGTFNPLVSPNGGDFFGLTSTDAIFRIDVGLPNGYAVVDNVQFSAVPEPGTWTMLLLGFAAIGSALRRQRRKVAAAA